MCCIKKSVQLRDMLFLREKFCEKRNYVMKILLSVILLSVGFVTATPALSAKSYFSGVSISTVRVHGSGAFGGCVMVVDKNVVSGGTETLDAYCSTNTVSFACNDSAIQSKTDSANMLNIALLAKATGGTIQMQVNDQKRKNGTCVADVIAVE